MHKTAFRQPLRRVKLILSRGFFVLVLKCCAGGGSPSSSGPLKATHRLWDRPHADARAASGG